MSGGASRSIELNDGLHEQWALIIDVMGKIKSNAAGVIRSGRTKPQSRRLPTFHCCLYDARFTMVLASQDRRLRFSLSQLLV